MIAKHEVYPDIFYRHCISSPRSRPVLRRAQLVRGVRSRPRPTPLPRRDRGDKGRCGRRGPGPNWASHLPNPPNPLIWGPPRRRSKGPPISLSLVGNAGVFVSRRCTPTTHTLALRPEGNRNGRGIPRPTRWAGHRLFSNWAPLSSLGWETSPARIIPAKLLGLREQNLPPLHRFRSPWTRVEALELQSRPSTLEWHSGFSCINVSSEKRFQFTPCSKLQTLEDTRVIPTRRWAGR